MSKKLASILFAASVLTSSEQNVFDYEPSPTAPRLLPPTENRSKRAKTPLTKKQKNNRAKNQRAKAARKKQRK